MADSNLTVEMVITDRFGTEITVISDPIVIFDDLPIIESVNFTGGVNFGNTITLIPNVVGGNGRSGKSGRSDLGVVAMYCCCGGWCGCGWCGCGWCGCWG